MRLVTIEMQIMLETDNPEEPSIDSLIDNIVLFTQAAIRNSTINGDMDFGINIKEQKEERVVCIEKI